MEEQFRNLIKTQSVLIHTLCSNVEYMMEYYKNRHEAFNGNKHLLRLYHLVQNDTVLILYKLVKHDENYSIDNLKRTIDSDNRFDSDSIVFKKITSISRDIKKLYKKYKIGDIIDTYVGHFDLKRNEFFIKPVQFQELKKLITEYYNLVESLMSRNITNFEEENYKSLLPIIELELSREY